MSQQRVTFSAGDIEYAVLSPDPSLLAEGRRVYDRAFRRAVSAAAPKRAKVEAILRDRGLWDDTAAVKGQRLLADIAEGVDRLALPGLPVDEGLAVARRIHDLRQQLLDLNRDCRELDRTTAEAQADDACFNFYVPRCLVYGVTGQPVYRDLNDYLEHADEPHAARGAALLAALLIPGLDPDHDANLPEAVYLAAHGAEPPAPLAA